jgi:hypothetical protein
MMVVAERVIKEAESGLADATGTVDGNMRAKKRVTCAV